MTDAEIRDRVLRALGEVAPEMDASTLDPARPIREQLDIDSVDLLEWVVGLETAFGIRVPETDYPRLATLDDSVRYLAGKV